jgi:SlyX protein
MFGPRRENAGMSESSLPQDVDKRLTDLEIKVSFTEDLVDHLNELVARQQEQIDLLIREVGKLKDRTPDSGGPRDVADERPPHY